MYFNGVVSFLWSGRLILVFADSRLLYLVGVSVVIGIVRSVFIARW